MMTQDTLEHFLVIREAQKLSSGLRFGPGIMKNGQNDPAVKKSVLAYTIV